MNPPIHLLALRHPHAPATAVVRHDKRTPISRLRGRLVQQRLDAAAVAHGDRDARLRDAVEVGGLVDARHGDAVVDCCGANGCDGNAGWVAELGEGSGVVEELWVVVVLVLTG